jgi:hypothetical protein
MVIFTAFLQQILFAELSRAGIKPYSSFTNLAEFCVFIKQSQQSILCF